jgi:hypothetical protein
MNPITIIIKTIFEIPTVIIKTAGQAPKVIVETGAEGGPLGCLFGILLMLALCGGIAEYSSNAIEDYRKTIDPSYVTTKEKKEIEKKRQEALSPRNIQQNAKADLCYKKELNFYPFDLFRMGECIWVCGNVVNKENKVDEESHPAVVYSANGGKEWIILAQLDHRIHKSHPSKIVLLDGENGFLLVGYGSTNLFRTRNGGSNWEKILTSERFGPAENLRIQNIRIHEKDVQRISIGIFCPGSSMSIETWSDGKHWQVINDGKVVAWTENNGVNWWSQDGKPIR